MSVDILLMMANSISIDMQQQQQCTYAVVSCTACMFVVYSFCIIHCELELLPLLRAGFTNTRSNRQFTELQLFLTAS